MDDSNPPFASSEFVMRWLAEVESESFEDERSQLKHRQRVKGSRSPSPSRNPRPEIHMSPRKPCRDSARTRDRSPMRGKADPMDKAGGGEDDEVNGSTRYASSDPVAHIQARDNALKNSQPQQAAPHDPSEKYARRPRHKTKANRYEYKGDVIRKSPVKTISKSKQRRSRRNKTGGTLNQDFKAPNVKQKRLTLKMSAGPGIFGKGKASALLRTAGLPDLTFSEMNFLSKKRQPDSGQAEELKRTHTSKKKDRSKEISGFFAKAQSEAARPHRTSSEVPQRQSSMGRTEWETTPAVSSPAKLPSRIELSQGLGVRSNSRQNTKRVEQFRRPTDYKADDIITQRNHHQNSGLLPAESATKLVSTSCSWSFTPSRGGSREQVLERSATAEQGPPQSAQQSKPNPIYDSSITNSSLDRYTRNVLLENDGIWRQHHPAPLGPTVFSLDGLKGLARVAEIEDRYAGILGVKSKYMSHLEPEVLSMGPGASAAYCVQSDVGLRKCPTMSPLPKGDVSEERLNQIIPATPGRWGPWQLHGQENHQYQALQMGAAPSHSVGFRSDLYAMQHDPPVIDHARHLYRPSYTFDDYFGRGQGFTHEEQQFYHTHQQQSRAPTSYNMNPHLDLGAHVERHHQDIDNEHLQTYRGTMPETCGPAMSVIANIPELDGLLDAEYSGECMRTYEQRLGVHFSGYENEQENIGLGSCLQDSAEQHPPSGGRHEVPAWNRNLALNSFDGPEEGFQGFSRPQILY